MRESVREMAFSGSRPAVACILLNWNGWRDTLGCLDALSLVRYPSTVIVVDNASTDDSLLRIRAAHPDVTLLESGGNFGFAAGNNVGIRYALERGFDYLWLLNNDTVPDPASLGELIAKAESDSRLGAVGSVLYYADAPNAIQAWGGGKVSTLLGYSRHALAARPDGWFDYLTAASMLVRAEAVRQAGLLDEHFFLYWEDTEFGVRLRRNGWKLGVAATARVLHKENGSTGGKRALVDRYFTASGVLFLSRTARFPWLSIPVFIVLRTAKCILKGQWERVRYIARGACDAISRLRRG